MNSEAVRANAEHCSLSLNDTCKLLKKSKAKVKSLFGTRIRIMPAENNRYNCNMADVLELIGQNI